MEEIQISEQIIGCTTRPYSNLSFKEACVHIANAGYTDVAIFENVIDVNRWEVPVRSNSTATEVCLSRRTAIKAGLEPSMLLGHTRLDLGLEIAVKDYKKLIDNAAELGTKWLLDCGIGKEDYFNNYYRLMRCVAPYAEQKGVNITLKPHGGLTLTIEDLIEAYKKIDHSAFGLCYDPGNIIYYTKGKIRPETDIDKISTMVTTVIIKDCVINNGKPNVLITPGEGLVNFERILSSLINSGFKGPLYVECVGGTEIYEIDRNIRSTLRFIKDILEKL
jgi:sugar phosphate isomerase/epimerase